MSPDAMEAVVARMRALLQGLQGAGGDLLRAMLSHHLGWQAREPAADKSAASLAGKLVRPRLCLLSCDAVGGDAAAAVPAAAAIELIHNFSLIHDDIEDRDELRRGRPTVWKRWGEAQAINAGDCMYSLAYAALSEPPAPAADPHRRLRALAIMSDACIRLCEGQSHDLALQSQSAVSQAEYLDMIGRKTAALMACAAQMGAVLGGAGDEIASAFREFGCQLGLAFQIRDDVLGIWGDSALTGKPVGADLRRRRCSYPVAWALERAQGAERAAILGVREASSPAAIEAAVAALDRLRAREQAEEFAAELHDRAWNALESLDLQPRATQGLRDLTHFLTIRQR